MNNMNIYQKMSAITAELSAVAKNLKVGEGKSSYKAVGEADVLAAVKPLEAKHGVFSYPVERRIVDSDILTTKKSYNGNESESTKVFLRIETLYRFVNIDDPSDYIDIKTYGDGFDAQDKAPGKAMTYRDKYARLKAYKIITGEDPDQNASEEGSFTRGRAKPDPYTCESCGGPIRNEEGINGDLVPASEIIRLSVARTGKHLCGACLKKADAAKKAEAMERLKAQAGA